MKNKTKSFKLADCEHYLRNFDREGLYQLALFLLMDEKDKNKQQILKHIVEFSVMYSTTHNCT